MEPASADIITHIIYIYHSSQVHLDNIIHMQEKAPTYTTLSQVKPEIHLSNNARTSCHQVTRSATKSQRNSSNFKPLYRQI